MCYDTSAETQKVDVDNPDTDSGCNVRDGRFSDVWLNEKIKHIQLANDKYIEHPELHAAMLSDFKIQYMLS